MILLIILQINNFILLRISVYLKNNIILTNINMYTCSGQTVYSMSTIILLLLRVIVVYKYL